MEEDMTTIKKAQLQIEKTEKSICNTIAVLPSIPPICIILSDISMNTVQTTQLPFPRRGPGNSLNDRIAVCPVNMALFPNSNCTATFTRQLTMMIQKATNPALAPRVVVAINSPDPTMEADRINPGPRNFNFLKKGTGGSLMVLSVITYVSAIISSISK